MTLTLAHPESLLFLLCIPAFFLLRKHNILQKPAFPLVFADWNGTPFEWKYRALGAARVLSAACCVAAFFACTAALSDPMFVSREKVYTSRGADIVFVIDISPSMAALDIGSGTRLDAAKLAVAETVRRMKGVSFALIAMGSDAALIVPATMDHETFLSRLESLQIGALGDGTAIGTGIATAVYHASASTSPEKCIVVMTDGENNAGVIHPQSAAKIARGHNIAVYVNGIGTKGRVLLEYSDPVSGKLYSGYLDSDFDERPLHEIAHESGGRYFSTEDLNALQSALLDICGREHVEQTFYYKTSEKLLSGQLFAAAVILSVFAWMIRRMYMKEIL